MTTLLRIDAQLILIGDAYEQTTAEAVFRALERDSVLAPERWGAEAGLRDPYDRGALLEALSTNPDDLVPFLYRKADPCAYNAKWYGEEAVCTLTLETRGQLDSVRAAAFCDAISRLAASVPTDWGHVTPVFADAPPGTAMKPTGNFNHIGYYANYGPACVMPRTFIGARVAALMTADSPPPFPSLGLLTRQLGNGTVELDLVRQPWTVDPTTLKRAQHAAQSKLVSTGIFCNEADDVDTSPGPRWEPPQLLRRRP